QIAADAFRELATAIPGATPLARELPISSAVYMSLFDRLVVYDDITPPANGPYQWNPVPFDKGPGATMESWMPLPFRAPEEVLLPGFHTAAETSIRDANAAGYEIFFNVCGLMSTGTRTVLLSRWRPGGKSSYDQVREFA